MLLPGTHFRHTFTTGARAYKCSTEPTLHPMFLQSRRGLLHLLHLLHPRALRGHITQRRLRGNTRHSGRLGLHANTVRTVRGLRRLQLLLAHRQSEAKCQRQMERTLSGPNQLSLG